MSDKVSLPILAGGKFTGRALTHINELTDSKVSALEAKAFEAIDRKADQATFDTFLNTVTNQLSDSEARTALAGVQAAVGAERTAREEADTRLAGRVTALEEAEPDLSGYATKEELATAVGGRSDKLTVYSGGSVNLGEATEGKMLGYLVKTPGTIAGQDVLPGEVWVFVADGQSWTPFQAGAGGGSGVAVAGVSRPAPKTSEVTDTGVTVTWESASGATSYEGRVNGGQAQAVTSPWKVTGLASNSSHTVEVRSVGEAGSSAWSALVFKTLAPKPVGLPWTITGFGDATTMTLSTTTTTNDTVVGTVVPYGKFARSTKAIPGTTPTGFFEVNIPAATETAFTVALTDYSTNNIGQFAIGLSVQPTGSLNAQGGVFAGGVAIQGASLSKGTRFRFIKGADGTASIEQMQGAEWVRLTSLTTTKGSSSLYLAVGGGANATYRVESLSAVGVA